MLKQPTRTAKLPVHQYYNLNQKYFNEQFRIYISNMYACNTYFAFFIMERKKKSTKTIRNRNREKALPLMVSLHNIHPCPVAQDPAHWSALRALGTS